MSGKTPHFHDPELKDAIVRAKGGHTASADLRAKVIARMAAVRDELQDEARDKAVGNGQPASASQVPLMRLAGTEPDGPSNSLRIRSAQKPWYLTRSFFAVAAMLIVAIGGGSMYFNHLQHEAEEREEYLENNRPLLLAMIGALQGQCDSGPNHEVISNTSDPRGLSKDLTKRLGRDVPPVDLKGWTVEQVSICQVGPAQAAHWRLMKDGKRMTVLSLPKQAFNIEEYEDYDFRLNNHAIAGFLRQGSINCVVCDPSVSDRDAIRLRDELKRG